MKNKFFLALTAILATGALLMPAFAKIQGALNTNPGLEVSQGIDKKIDFGTQVKLQCQVGTPVEFPTITVTNNTNQTVPAGTKIFWQANASMKGTIVLSAPLGPGRNVKTTAEAMGSSYNPVAWYFK